METVYMAALVAWCRSMDHQRRKFVGTGSTGIFSEDHIHIVTNCFAQASGGNTDDIRFILLCDVLQAKFQVVASAEHSGVFVEIR